MFDSLLVANRAEIAGRVLRSARAMGLHTVAVHSEIDSGLPYVAAADRAVLLPGPPAQAYRNIDALLAAARDTGAQAIHPGYGFLSEDADFARAVIDADLIWVGPPPSAIEAMSDKIAARNLMEAAGVPVAPGTDRAMRSAFETALAAEAIGYPVMVKAAAGGGGMGLTVVDRPEQVEAVFEQVTAFAGRMFGNAGVFVEQYFPRVRHIEVQILGLADGRVVALGERECSVQRRHQKLAEETPSPALDAPTRAALLDAARRAGEAVDYRGAGTVEFLFAPAASDPAPGSRPGSASMAQPGSVSQPGAAGQFFFLEMNTRLQVEHPITEAVLGIDLVAAQLRIAAGGPPDFDPDALEPRGHALELRINAEDSRRFLPGPGVITAWTEPAGPGIRVDAGYGPGTTVTPSYDSLMAKLIVHAADRAAALALARTAVAGFTVTGPKSNLEFHSELLANPDFISGDYDTALVTRMRT